MEKKSPIRVRDSSVREEVTREGSLAINKQATSSCTSTLPLVTLAPSPIITVSQHEFLKTLTKERRTSKKENKKLMRRSGLYTGEEGNGDG